VFVKNLDRSRDLEREDEDEDEEEDEDDDLFRSFFWFCFRSRLFRFLKDRDGYNSLSIKGSLACNILKMTTLSILIKSRSKTLEGKTMSRKTGLRILKYFCGSGPWITNAAFRKT
jgi:hypothetical protein